MQSGQMAVRGVVARVEWGYFTAAKINNYSIRRARNGDLNLVATAVEVNAFNLRQRDLIFVAPHRKGEWRWKVRSLDLGEGHGPRPLRAILGSQIG